MKRLSLLGFIGMMATFLAGCPIWGDDDDWTEPCRSESCSPGGCSLPSDCGVNETCGQDKQCHPGSCTVWGCSTGFECIVEDNKASCQPTTSGSGGAGGAGGAGGSGGAGGAGGGPGVVWCGNPDDCAAGETCAPDGTCKPGACDTVGCIYG